MREILFRGKRTDNGEWCYGHLYKNYFGDWVIVNEKSRLIVNDKTIGQYTGLTDKNGRKIFEGDIIAYRKGCLAVSFDFASFGFLFEGYNGEEGYSHVIPFNDYENGIYIDRKTYQIDYEIVGNVFDNSDLLKGE